MVAVAIAEDSKMGAEMDNPNFEIDWDHLHVLLKVDNPWHDLITDLIDRLSEDDREHVRNSLGYADVYCPDYKTSRAEWIQNAEKFRGTRLTPDEFIALVNKHRIYYAVTHPRKMNVHPHTPDEESAVSEFLFKVKCTLGHERCCALGYKFDE